MQRRPSDAIDAARQSSDMTRFAFAFRPLAQRLVAYRRIKTKNRRTVFSVLHRRH
jgi:hypothetical protein